MRSPPPRPHLASTRAQAPTATPRRRCVAAIASGAARGCERRPSEPSAQRETVSRLAPPNGKAPVPARSRRTPFSVQDDEDDDEDDEDDDGEGDGDDDDGEDDEEGEEDEEAGEGGASGAGAVPAKPAGAGGAKRAKRA